MADKPLGVRRIETEGGMVVEGNPEAVPLHEALSAVSDWMDYESDVVQEAAEELEKEGHSELANKAEDQAEAMEEAAAAVDDAADEAREAAAVAFSEGGTPASEIAAEATPEGEVVGGNPVQFTGAASFAKSKNQSDAEAIKFDKWVEQERNEGSFATMPELWGAYADKEAALGIAQAEAQIAEGNPYSSEDAKELKEARADLVEEEGSAEQRWDLTIEQMGPDEWFIASEHDLWTPRGPFKSKAAAEAYLAEWFGNPDFPPIPEADPTPEADPPAPDTPPESNHWYDRPLIRR